jgi:C1A family cysteine protease
LAKQGICAEAKWPYVVGKFAVKPSSACYSDARQHRISSYERLQTVDEMRQCLADGYPFVFGFTVYESFESSAVAKSGILNMPTSKEKVVGGHAVMAAGYDDKRKRLLIRNSWGTNWGQRGYFWMPYGYVSENNLSDDFWTIRRGKNL